MPLPTIAIPVEVLDAEVIKARELLVRAWSDIEVRHVHVHGLSFPHLIFRTSNRRLQAPKMY